MQRTIARWAPLAAAGMLIVGVAATARQAVPCVGLVNLPAIMSQTPGYEEARATFREEFAPIEEELESLVQRRDSMIQEYERQSVVLSPTARTEKETEIRDLQQRVEQHAEEFQTRQQERERELLTPLEQRVQAVVEGIRAERNLTIILDVASASGIVAADPAADLTPVVVQRLQQSQ